MNTNILVSGYISSGKTSLIKRFVLGEFDGKYIPTLRPRIYTKELEINDLNFKFQLLDLPGEAQLNKIPYAYFRNKNLLIYCIDLSQAIDYKAIHKDLNYLKNSFPDLIIKIVGNKKDLLDASLLEAVRQALEPNSFYAFTSALEEETVNALFNKVAGDHLTRVRA